MTGRTILILAIFVGMCGFIAYFGDLLGRRMGKRRLTLFGLRPRYSAIVITSITGMLIAAFTIGVMALTSQNVRLLMLKGDNIISRMNSLTRRYDDAARSYRRAVDTLGKQRRITTAANQEAERAGKQSALLTADMMRVRQNLAGLKQDLRKNQDALMIASRQLSGTRTGLADAKREVTSRRREIANQQKEIGQLEVLQNRLAERLDKEAIPRLMALRERRVIFRQGEEIARKVIDSAQSIAGIRSDMVRLLDEADSTAREKGAKPGSNGSAVQILPKSVEDSPGKIRFLEDQQTINAIVDNIHSADGSVVVLVLSVGNSLEGEQALIEFAPPFRNKRIYAGHDEVASVVLDGGRSKGAILSDLIAFLRTKVRPAAIDKGIIPQFDADGQPVVGQIDDWDKIFDLVDKIKGSGKQVRVRALAAADTWSSGPLTLDFEVGDPQ